jgi:hypothetical protein
MLWVWDIVIWWLWGDGGECGDVVVILLERWLVMIMIGGRPKLVNMEKSGRATHSSKNNLPVWN